MFCFRYKKLLMPYMEGALSPGAESRIKRHLECCDNCRQELADITAAARALQGATIPIMEPRHDLWDRIRTQIEPQPAARPLWRVRNVQAVSAALVGCTLLLFVMVRPIYQPGQESVEQYSVDKPEVVEQTRPSRAGTSAPPAPLKDKPNSSVPQKDLKFGGGQERAAAPPPAFAPATSPKSTDWTAFDRNAASVEPRPLPPPAVSQTQGIPGGSQLPMDPSQTSNVSGGGLRNSPVGEVQKTDQLSQPSGEGLYQQQTERATTKSTDATYANPPSAAAGSQADTSLRSPAPTRQQSAVQEQARPASDTRRLQALRTDYVQRLQRNPNDTTTLQQLAEVETQLGNKGAVVTHRKKLADLQPDLASRWVELGDAYEANAQSGPAAEAYRKALRIGLTREQAVEVNRKMQGLYRRRG